MSRTTKIVLGIGILGLVGCGLIVAAGGWAGMKLFQGMKTDPAEVTQVANSMADFTLPEGMKAVISMEIMGMKAVVFSAGGTESTGAEQAMSIMMMQLPAGASDSTDTNQMQEAMQRQMGRQGGEVMPVGEKTVTIKGKPVTFQVSESTAAKGAMKQMVGLFEGKAGQVMLMIMGPSSGWDEAAADTFLSSIR